MPESTPTSPGSTLLARQRQEEILRAVTEHGGVRVADVVEQLGVSEMTVRRDIASLVKRGLVTRVHGGAVSPSRSTHEPAFSAKAAQHAEAKARIGATAARLVQPGDAVALGAGTTTLAVAREIARLPYLGTLTIITNSIPAADVLHQQTLQARSAGAPTPTTVLTGGERTPSDALVGPSTVEFLTGVHVDWVFLGAHGFDPAIGLMSPNLQEAATNVALVATGGRAVAVLDSTTWGVRGLRTFCAFEQLATIVTDTVPDEGTLRAADTHDVTIEVASA